MVSQHTIATFLHFGHLTEVPEGIADLPWSRIRASDVLPEGSVREEELLAPGLAALRAACDGDGAGAPHVVMLSGGLDSRILLAALLERGLRDSIVTVTFGIPGTLDFDLAPAVARAAGVRHELLDLSRIEVGEEALVNAVRTSPWTPALETVFNHLVPARFGQGATYWSGYMGDTVGGSDIEPPASWADTCRAFAAGTRMIRSTVLTPPGFRPETALPPEPPIADSAWTHDEQLYTYVRCPNRNRSALLAHGHDFRTPFLHPAWIDFMLRLPRSLRVDQRLYRRLALHAYPQLFALPIKNSLGLALDAPRWRLQLRRALLKAGRLLRSRLPRLVTRPDPKLNYLDLDAELRRPSALARAVARALERLRERGVVDWLDLAELERRHQAGHANHGEALVLLACLELNLAAQGG